MEFFDETGEKAALVPLIQEDNCILHFDWLSASHQPQEQKIEVVQDFLASLNPGNVRALVQEQSNNLSWTEDEQPQQTQPRPASSVDADIVEALNLQE